MKKMICGAIAVFASVSAFAQMGSPVPKEMEHCKAMVGKWEGTLTMAFMGQEQKSKATMVNKMSLNGRYLIGDHTYEMSGMNMYGHQMMTYDARQKKWMSWWFDSAEAGAMEMSGEMKGNSLVMISKPTPIGTSDVMMEMRSAYKHLSATEVEFKLEMKEGDKWVPMLWGTYKKVG